MLQILLVERLLKLANIRRPMEICGRKRYERTDFKYQTNQTNNHSQVNSGRNGSSYSLGISLQGPV